MYSPDGEWVAFSSNRGGGMNLWLVSTVTGNLRRVTEAHVNWDPAFTRDGRRLLWSSNRGGNFEIWTADVDGSGPRQVTQDGGNAENPTATPDGQWVVYSSGNPQKAGLWKIHPDGTGATQVVKGRVSPARRLARRPPRDSTASSRASTRRCCGSCASRTGRPSPSRSRSTRGGGRRSRSGRARWMPDGKAIAFVGQDESGASGIYVQDFVPGRDTAATRRKLAGFDPDVAAESFGLCARRLAPRRSPGWVQLFSLMEGEGLPGLLAPPHGGAAR